MHDPDRDAAVGHVTLSESDGYVVATDEETGVTSQGTTRAEALRHLADALALAARPVDEAEDVDAPSDAPWL